MDRMTAKVAIENVAFDFDKEYSYNVPDSLAGLICRGCRVTVPFGSGKTKRQGIVLSLIKDEGTKNLKDIQQVLSDGAELDENMIQLAYYMKEHTFCSLYDAFKTILPAGLSYKMSPDGAGARTVGDSHLRMVRLCPDVTDVPSGLSVKQKTVFDFLAENGSVCVKEVCYYTGVTDSVVKRLVSAGIAEFYDKEVLRDPKKPAVKMQIEKTSLTQQQQKALSGLLDDLKKAPCTSLLYGVTGSGKTQVYLSLIDEVIKTGRGIIVMVPEISLTPQTLDIFTKRYGNNLALFHSGLSLGERLDEYKRVKRGEAKIVIGTRSAVFAPFKDIGLIIMDEEQEHTYKSSSSPRYRTADVAAFRCAQSNGMLVLASATPSIESYTYAQSGRYGLEKLTQRYGDAELPEVMTVDMTEQRAMGNSSEISTVLLTELMYNLENKKQSIILLNRRGYNTFVVCDSCKKAVTCPNCSVTMTYHSANSRLMCHYCGYSVPFTKTCPECGKDTLRYMGTGTQKTEEELQQKLPSASILRMDADSTMAKNSFEEKLKDFSDGKYDIMLGTQMVAKGLDFENVTLVGVLCADASLFADDYESAERTFDLLTQVTGRAGRGRFAGKAVIQTIDPQSSVIKYAKDQDYESFYKNEIVIRKNLIYPPYCNICRLTFASSDEQKAYQASKAFFSLLSDEATASSQKIIVYGPMSSRIFRCNGKYRYDIMIKCRNGKEFRNMLSGLLITFREKTKINNVTVITDMEA